LVLLEAASFVRECSHVRTHAYTHTPRSLSHTHSYSRNLPRHKVTMCHTFYANMRVCTHDFPPAPVSPTAPLPPPSLSLPRTLSRTHTGRTGGMAMRGAYGGSGDFSSGSGSGSATPSWVPQVYIYIVSSFKPTEVKIIYMSIYINMRSLLLQFWVRFGNGSLGSRFQLGIGYLRFR